MTESYDVSGLLPGGVLDELPAGTNTAIVGPTMTGKQELALSMLAAGYETGEGILCVTTDSAEKIYADLERHVGSLDRGRVGIIGTSGGDRVDFGDASTEHVSSPGDLTGISISTAKLFKQFENRGISEIRYGLISISTLLQYLDENRVFQFLHLYGDRIEKTGGLGFYTLDSDSHDPQIVNTITAQFDGVIELRETDPGDLEYRVRGFGRRPTPWNEF